MIPKARKPEPRDHRPIPLTNVGYKIFMSLVKDKIVDHINQMGEESKVQSGFTGDWRLEHNLFILWYCIEMRYRREKPLFVKSIDFTNAYNSVDRVELLRALIWQRCDPYLIHVVTELYTGDCTDIFKGKMNTEKVEVSNIIHLGCTGSPQLFVMVVNMVIREILASTLDIMMKI